jgi:hypothetical protein
MRRAMQITSFVASPASSSRMTAAWSGVRSVAPVLVALVVASMTACSPDSADPIGAPDAAPPPTALDPAGRYAISSTHALAAPPPDIAPLLAELAAATDGSDDPTAYLVDLVVNELPEGSARSVAIVLAPYVATELHGRIAAYAPNLAPALRAMAMGAQRISTRFSTIEDMVITADPPVGYIARGRVRRTIRGIRIDNTEIPFSAIGLADASAEAEITVELVGMATRAEDPRVLSNRVAIARHALPLSVGAWFRPAFDRAVIPSVVPGATDLAAAFRTLVDCPRLGALIAEAVGIGPASLYAQACTIGVGVGARTIYERFPGTDARPLALDVMGVARAIDRDGDGVMDAVDGGVWSGRLGEVSVGAAVFDGTSR